MKTILLTILALAASAQQARIPRPSWSPATPKPALRPSYSASSPVTGPPPAISNWSATRRTCASAACENGETYFVEIFTWRDAAIPDHAPPAIQSIWAEMNKLVEGRGIEIAEVTPY